MSEQEEGHPPDPEMRNRPAGDGTANRRINRKTNFKKHEEITETTADIQVRSLRQHFAVGYCLAASLAPLIWGAGPR